jgi:hypothetical protein
MIEGYIKINTKYYVTDNKGLLLLQEYMTIYIQVYEYKGEYYVEDKIGNQHLIDREYLVNIYCGNDIDRDTLYHVIREKRLGKLLD